MNALCESIDIRKVRARKEDLEEQLCRPEAAAQKDRFRETVREHAFFKALLELLEQHAHVRGQLREHGEMLLAGGDEDFLALVRAENEELDRRKAGIEQQVKMRLLPKDENAGRDVIVEIRAGTGGDEAALFGAELSRMYTRYCERQGWKLEVLSSTPTGLGGLKEMIVSVHGEDAYLRLKNESGTHRVQRVPETEASGRIHTSAVTVAVLPEAEEVELNIEAADIRVDVYRSSGHGGQSVNTTDSAVRITHLATGLVVTCQDEKSQFKNKAKAMRILRSRLLDRMQHERAAEIATARKAQVGSGDRSEKIRTYNFPQNRVTDHRIGLTLYNLGGVMEGDLDPLTVPLLEWEFNQSLEKNEVLTSLQAEGA